MRRFAMTIAMAGVLLAVSAPTVLGHECTIASRSDKGDAGALHSARWVRLTLADVFGFIHTVIPGENPGLTPDQIDEAVAIAVAAGLPADGWVIRSDKTIGEGSNNPNLANGKGLDHLADSVGGQIAGIYFQVLGG
jgi:hypothetical protein